MWNVNIWCFSHWDSVFKRNNTKTCQMLKLTNFIVFENCQSYFSVAMVTMALVNPGEAVQNQEATPAPLSSFWPPLVARGQNELVVNLTSAAISWTLTCLHINILFVVWFRPIRASETSASRNSTRGRYRRLHQPRPSCDAMLRRSSSRCLEFLLCWLEQSLHPQVTTKVWKMIKASFDFNLILFLIHLNSHFNPRILFC